MKIVGHAENGIKLSNIVEIMNLKMPAVHHMTKTLISCGFLKKSQNNNLFLGNELAVLAEKCMNSALREAASAEMQVLFNSFPQCVIILAEVKAPVIELSLRVSYERPNVLQKQNDQTFNIYVNAVGLASLAMSDAQTQELLMDKQPYAEYGAHLWKDWHKFMEYLRQIKEQGYAICPFDQQTSFRMAVPIINRDGECKGAIGVSIPASRMNIDIKPDFVINETVNAVRRINEKLK